MFKVSTEDYDFHNDLERAIFMKDCLRGEYEFTLDEENFTTQIKKGETVIEWKRFYYDVLLGIPKIIQSEKDRFNKDMDEYNKKKSKVKDEIDKDIRRKYTSNSEFVSNSAYNQYCIDFECKIGKWKEENTFEYDKYMNFETYDTFKSNFNKICIIKETLEHMAIVLEFNSE